MERFNSPAFVGAVNFYRTEKDKLSHNACGAIVLYMRFTSSEQILKGVGIRGFDEDDDEAVAGKFGEFCLSMAEGFNAALTANGYPNLELSDAIVARNSIAKGVEFSYDQYDRYELSFVYKKEKILSADLTMTNIGKR